MTIISLDYGKRMTGGDKSRFEKKKDDVIDVEFEEITDIKKIEDKSEQL